MFVADNYEYFFQLAKKPFLTEEQERLYALQLKKKISCFNAETNV